MSRSPLASALAADTDHVTSFRADGTETRWTDFVAAACRVHGALAERPERNWALRLDDPHEFACSLVGCWAADKTAVIAPNPILDSGDPELEIDGTICSAPREAEGRRTLALSELPPAGATLESPDPESELVLYTSGSTGRPKRVSRRLENVEAELEVFEALWGPSLPAGRVYSTVSHRHVYGMLFRVLWPLVSGRAFAAFDFEYPEQLLGGVGTGNALITSPALLKRIGHLGANEGQWRLIYSSGGLLPRSAAADAERVLGACPIEVLGSTETSGVAWRQQQDDALPGWLPFPDAKTRADDDGFLEVASPYSGQPGWFKMGDLVTPLDNGRFELGGRGDNIAKIEDKRVSLAEIERLALEHEHVVEAAAVALDDRTRQYIGVALQLSPTGKAELTRLGKRAYAEMLRTFLRPKVEPIVLPRKFRFVGELPVNAQGKRIQASIKRLFGAE